MNTERPAPRSPEQHLADAYAITLIMLVDRVCETKKGRRAVRDRLAEVEAMIAPTLDNVVAIHRGAKVQLSGNQVLPAPPSERIEANKVVLQTLRRGAGWD